ncbi:MAG TPA: hypothetical protein VLQ45_26350 [Thermoanaerobaculia bacterium]|nr:hypothetical protein [Thermoanaerobaculia bacterium]
MRSTTLIATAALALSLTSAAQAQWSNRYPDRGRNNSRVSELAYEIEATATSIYREAARNNRRPDRDEARVLSNLRELENRAQEFRQEVRDGRWGNRRYDDRYDRRDDRRYDRRDSREDARDYDRLADAFYATADSLRYINRRPYIDRGMDRIYVLLREVSQSYGGNDRWGWSDRRGWRDRDDFRGRYDRDRGRYDRDDRWRH